jgi:hypothetical protein
MTTSRSAMSEVSPKNLSKINTAHLQVNHVGA